MSKKYNFKIMKSLHLCEKNFKALILVRYKKVIKGMLK